MNTPGRRIVKWREHLGVTASEFSRRSGIPYTTLKTFEADDNKIKPSYDVLAKLRKAFPQLNIDWLFDEGDSEPMLREHRALVPASSRDASLGQPEPEPPQGPARMRVNREGELESYPLLVAELRARLADKDRELERTYEQLAAWQDAYRKPPASAEAAAQALPSPCRPIGPRYDAAGLMWVARQAA